MKNSVTVQTLKEIFSYSIVIQRSNIQNFRIFKTFKIFKNTHKLYPMKNAGFQCVIVSSGFWKNNSTCNCCIMQFASQHFISKIWNVTFRKQPVRKQRFPITTLTSQHFASNISQATSSYATFYKRVASKLYICDRKEYQINPLILWNVYLMVMTNRRSLPRYLVSSHRN